MTRKQAIRLYRRLHDDVGRALLSVERAYDFESDHLESGGEDLQLPDNFVTDLSAMRVSLYEKIKALCGLPRKRKEQR